MGKGASDNLIDDLEKDSYNVYQRLKKFTEIVHTDSIKLPVCCFFETKKTDIYRRILPRSIARWIEGYKGFIVSYLLTLSLIHTNIGSLSLNHLLAFMAILERVLLRNML